MWNKKKCREIPEWITRVRSRLSELCAADPTLRMFGAYMHQYRLGPTLTESEITAAENHYQIMVSPEYRDFLLYLGNGGAGPGYGLQRFGVLTSPVVRHNPSPTVVMDRDGGVGPINEFADCFDELYFNEMERLITDRSFLAHPFPLARSWTLDECEMPDDDSAYFQWDIHVREPMFKHGSIELSDHGCGQKHKLVLTGDESGSVWVFDEQDYEYIGPYGAGMLPEDANPRRYTFAEWYEDWLINYIYDARKTM